MDCLLLLGKKMENSFVINYIYLGAKEKKTEQNQEIRIENSAYWVNLTQVTTMIAEFFLSLDYGWTFGSHKVVK